MQTSPQRHAPSGAFRLSLVVYAFGGLLGAVFLALLYEVLTVGNSVHKGGLVVFVWALDALIILGLSLAVPMSDAARPFCELCQVWTQSQGMGIRGGLLLVCSTAPFSAPAAFASGSGGSCFPARTPGPSFAPQANTPWYLVRFTRGGGIKLAVRRNSSNPVKYIRIQE